VTAKPVLRIPARSVQIGLGVLWLLDGMLQLQPSMFGPAFATHVIMPSAMGQPGVVSSAITQAAHFMAVDPALVNVVFAGVQLLIGAGLLVRETVKPALIVSFAWGFGVWSMGEGFGGLLTGSASPLTGAPGAALLYLIIGVLVWPRRRAEDVPGPAAAEGLFGAGGGRALWAALWCGLGTLWLLPATSAGGALSGALSNASSGEPSMLAHLQLSLSHALAGGAGTAAAVVAGLLSFVIGLGPLFVRRYALFLVAGVALSLDCWAFGESFGQIFTGLATDPNTGPLLILLALTIWPVGTRAIAPASARAATPSLVNPLTGSLAS